MLLTTNAAHAAAVCSLPLQAAAGQTQVIATGSQSYALTNLGAGGAFLTPLGQNPENPPESGPDDENSDDSDIDKLYDIPADNQGRIFMSHEGIIDDFHPDIPDPNPTDPAGTHLAMTMLNTCVWGFTPDDHPVHSPDCKDNDLGVYLDQMGVTGNDRHTANILRKIFGMTWNPFEAFNPEKANEYDPYDWTKPLPPFDEHQPFEFIPQGQMFPASLQWDGSTGAHIAVHFRDSSQIEEILISHYHSNLTGLNEDRPMGWVSKGNEKVFYVVSADNIPGDAHLTIKLKDGTISTVDLPTAPRDAKGSVTTQTIEKGRTMFLKMNVKSPTTSQPVSQPEVVTEPVDNQDQPQTVTGRDLEPILRPAAMTDQQWEKFSEAITAGVAVTQAEDAIYYPTAKEYTQAQQRSTLVQSITTNLDRLATTTMGLPGGIAFKTGTMLLKKVLTSQPTQPQPASPPVDTPPQPNNPPSQSGSTGTGSGSSGSGSTPVPPPVQPPAQPPAEPPPAEPINPGTPTAPRLNELPRSKLTGYRNQNIVN